MRRLLLYIALAIIISGRSYAQLSSGGQPKSFELSGKTTQPLAAVSSLPIKQMPAVDVAALLEEDKAEEKMGVPQRFGYPFEVNYDLTNSGVWETAPDGTKIWRLRIEAPGAYSINLVYDNFYLYDGVKFYIYNYDHSMLLGAYTSANNNPHGKFQTAPVKGDACILEINVPPDVNYPGIVSITTVVHAYRNFFKDAGTFNESGYCNNNVICPEADDWRDEINSVAMVLLGSGFRWCSGSMVNNTRQDLTPYFLTANHCLDEPENFIVMFNYQSSTCSPSTDGPTYMTLQGTTLLANNTTSDFALLLLDDDPPDSFNVYFNGWSAINSAATSSVGIHHPSGDVKKISFNDDPLTSTSYFGDTPGGNNSHWRVDNWEDGTTEGGSSGSPLYDQNHRVVGQLHGGWASCEDILADWYGKFSVSWDNGATPATRLVDWLDPDSTGVLTLDGIDQSGLSFVADTTFGWTPLSVSFTGTSKFVVDTWAWSFGDGDSSAVQHPSHTYIAPGAFDVRLDITTGGENYFTEKSNYIIALADTLKSIDTSGHPTDAVEIVLSARNNLPITRFTIPFEYDGPLSLTFDSMNTNGCRTDYFEIVEFAHYDAFNKRATAKVQVSDFELLPELAPGDGPILKLYFSISSSATPADTTDILFDGYTTYTPEFISSLTTYQPTLTSSQVTVIPSCCVDVRGNVDGDPSDQADISDLLYLVDFSFGNPPGPEPSCFDEADVNDDNSIDVSDLLYLVDYMFAIPAGPAPLDCF